MEIEKLDELIELITYIKELPPEERKALLIQLKGGHKDDRKEHNA